MTPPVHAFIPTIPASKSSTARALSSASSTLTPVQAATTVVPGIPARLNTAPIPSVYSPLQADVITPGAFPAAPGARPSRILLLFVDDLRVQDNPALCTAAVDASRVPTGALVPAIVSSSSSPSSSLLSSFQSSLSSQLQTLGSSLVQLTDVQSVLDVVRRLNLQAIYFNRASSKTGTQLQARIVSALKQSNSNNKIEIQSFWGNSLLQPPCDDHLRCAKGRASCPGDKKSRASFLDVYNDVLAQSVNVTTSVLSPPDSLPALPVAVTTNTGVSIVQGTVKTTTTTTTEDGLKILRRMSKHRELLSHGKDADLYVLLKPFLDSGALSPRMIAKQTLSALGALKGRTFSELVWRTYVCVIANSAVGVRSARSSTVYA